MLDGKSLQLICIHRDQCGRRELRPAQRQHLFFVEIPECFYIVELDDTRIEMIKNQGQLEIPGIKRWVLTYQDCIKRIQIGPARLRKLQGIRPFDGRHQTHRLVVHQGDVFLLQPANPLPSLDQILHQKK